MIDRYTHRHTETERERERERDRDKERDTQRETQRDRENTNTGVCECVGQHTGVSVLGMNEKYKQETGESVDWRRRYIEQSGCVSKKEVGPHMSPCWTPCVQLI